MKNVNITVFNKETGQITKTVFCQEGSIDFYLGKNEDFIFGEHDLNKQYVVNGIAVDLPAKPAENYLFDYQSKTWVLNFQLAEHKALEKRNKLLADGPDRVNPMWWASMSIEQQNAWSQYRQDLLDITSQPDYPNVIIWPTPPQGA